MSVRDFTGVYADEARPAPMADGTNAEPKSPASIAAVVTDVKTFRLIDIL
jgi:hypothetical protein